MSERETVVELRFAANRCPRVEKLRTVLPLTACIRDSVVQLGSISGLACRCGRRGSKLAGGAVRTYVRTSINCRL
jgi:hypothetical protein